MICLKLHLKAQDTFRGSPEPPEVLGGAPCQTDMDCIKRVKKSLTHTKCIIVTHHVTSLRIYSVDKVLDLTAN